MPTSCLQIRKLLIRRAEGGHRTLTLHFGYDALNRMVSLERHNPDGSTLRARYAYDVFNRRIRKSVSQGQNQNTTTRVTRYGWDGERMCAEVMDGLTRGESGVLNCIKMIECKT